MSHQLHIEAAAPAAAAADDGDDCADAKLQ